MSTAKIVENADHLFTMLILVFAALVCVVILILLIIYGLNKIFNEPKQAERKKIDKTDEKEQ